MITVDGNKRTALVTMLTYLDLQGITISQDVALDDVMVEVASGLLDRYGLTQLLKEFMI